MPITKVVHVKNTRKCKLDKHQKLDTTQIISLVCQSSIKNRTVGDVKLSYKSCMYKTHYINLNVNGTTKKYTDDIKNMDIRR